MTRELLWRYDSKWIWHLKRSELSYFFEKYQDIEPVLLTPMYDLICCIRFLLWPKCRMRYVPAGASCGISHMTVAWLSPKKVFVLRHKNLDVIKQLKLLDTGRGWIISQQIKSLTLFPNYHQSPQDPSDGNCCSISQLATGVDKNYLLNALQQQLPDKNVPPNCISFLGWPLIKETATVEPVTYSLSASRTTSPNLWPKGDPSYMTPGFKLICRFSKLGGAGPGSTKSKNSVMSKEE